MNGTKSQVTERNTSVKANTKVDKFCCDGKENAEEEL
jgi:hypothetical protein